MCGELRDLRINPRIAKGVKYIYTSANHFLYVVDTRASSKICSFFYPELQFILQCSNLLNYRRSMETEAKSSFIFGGKWPTPEIV